MLSLEVPLSLTSRQESNTCEEDSRLDYYLPAASDLDSSVKDKGSLLSTLISFFSHKLEERIFMGLLPLSRSPFVTVRGEFKFPRAVAAAAAVVALWCRVTTKEVKKQRAKVI